MPIPADHLTPADSPAPGRWPVPASAVADVWRGMPSWWADPVDPLRDAVGAGMRALWIAVASTGVRLMASRLRAHGHGWALDLYARGAGVARLDGENDLALRTRLATVDDAVSIAALRRMASAAYPGTLVVQSWRGALYAGRGFVGRPAIDPQGTRLAGRVPFAASSRQVLETAAPVRFSDGTPELWVILPFVRATGRVVAWSGPDAARPGSETSPLSVAVTDPRATYAGRVALRNLPFLTTETPAVRARAVATGMERLRAAGNHWRGYVASR